MTRVQASSSTLAVSINTEEFQTGFVEGQTGVSQDCRFKLAYPITEEDVVDVIRNLTEIAVEGWLSESLLRHDAGLLAGWICRKQASEKE